MESELRIPGASTPDGRVDGWADGNKDASATGGGQRYESDGPVDDRPRSVYEVVTRRMLEDLKEDVSEVKGRVNTLLWLVAGAVVLEMVVRLVK
jgi:hypothetical protein